MVKVRFVDEMGKRIDDREMPECPFIGDSVSLHFAEDGKRVERWHSVVRRGWIPDGEAVTEDAEGLPRGSLVGLNPDQPDVILVVRAATRPAV